MNNFKPNDKVKICKYIESGVRFYYGGITCCCANTFQSPIINCRRNEKRKSYL